MPEPGAEREPALRGVDPLPVGPEGLVCSAKGCRQDAAFDLQWNNPKIHTADRRKHWLACAEHRDQLSSFLGSRGFLRDVQPLAAPGSQQQES